jgi:hypothetical protein
VYCLRVGLLFEIMLWISRCVSFKGVAFPAQFGPEVPVPVAPAPAAGGGGVEEVAGVVGAAREEEAAAAAPQTLWQMLRVAYQNEFHIPTAPGILLDILSFFMGLFFSVHPKWEPYTFALR